MDPLPSKIHVKCWEWIRRAFWLTSLLNESTSQQEPLSQKIRRRASKIAQQAKVLSAKPEDLSYVSQPTRWKEKMEMCSLGTHALAGQGWLEKDRKAGSPENLSNSWLVWLQHL